MQTITHTLQAAGVWVMQIQGQAFRLLDVAGPVTLRIFRGGRVVEEANEVESGFWFKLDDDGAYFDRFEIEGGAGSYKVAVSTGQTGGYDRVGGNVGAKLVSARSVLNRAPVAVSQVTTLLAVANDGRAGLRIWNNSTVNVYLGGAGVTVDNAAIKLAPGDFWDECGAPAAGWSAVADGTGASVRVQELLY